MPQRTCGVSAGPLSCLFIWVEVLYLDTAGHSRGDQENWLHPPCSALLQRPSLKLQGARNTCRFWCQLLWSCWTASVQNSLWQERHEDSLPNPKVSPAMANHFSQGLLEDLPADPSAITYPVSPGGLLTLVLVQTDHILHTEQKAQVISSCLTSIHLHSTAQSCPL